MVNEAMNAVDELDKQFFSCEVVDLRTIKPIDFDTVIASVKKAGRAVVAIEEWATASVSATIANGIYERCFNSLKAPVKLVTLPDTLAPESKSSEDVYYKSNGDIVRIVMNSFLGDFTNE